MHKLPRLLPLFALLAAPLFAVENPATAGARQADDARVVALTTGDAAKMNAVFSDDLIYVHSTGRVNHKADFIASVASSSLKYVTIDYEARNFRLVAPGLVLVSGRCLIHSISGQHEEHNHLSFLMAYRNEQGTWRFLAWQSCHLTDASPPYVP